MPPQLHQITELIEKQDYRKAEIAISKVFRSGESNKNLQAALSARSQIRLATGRIDEAIEDLYEIQRLSANHLDLTHTEILANALLARFEQAQVGFAERSDLIQATNLLNEAIKSDSQYQNVGWLYYQLGRIALIEHNITQAKDYLVQALLSPSKDQNLTAYCYERLGFLEYYEARDTWQALVFLDKAIHTYPTDQSPIWLVQVYLLRSRVLRDVDLEKSLMSAKQALEITKQASGIRESIAEVAFAIAEILSVMPEQQQAIVEYLQLYFSNIKRPVGVDVTWSRAYEMLGDAYNQLQQYDRAIASYETALQYNPYHPWEESIQYRIARDYYHQNEYSKTIKILEKLNQSSPQTIDQFHQYNVQNLLGNAYFALKDYHRATIAYQVALDNAPAGLDTEQTHLYLQLSQKENQPL